ncbi:MAG TPA: DUF192 domain-containing protein [Gaiellaceae bacterium]|nr:DUF192 domain-containing protein [Gaiellaceae bacterium]
MRFALALPILLAALLAAGASFGAGDEVRFPRGTATIATGERKLVLRVEVARTDEQRQRGLMQRRSLARNAGMVFQFPSATSGAFWMKNTLIPLDIAFYGPRGGILRIMQMKPCKADPCPLYDPKVSYRGALEVNAGSFRRWGVRRGDRIVVTRVG